jgi:glutathione synthase/RimK-type ligase-like ATP-grasp enzyme
MKKIGILFGQEGAFPQALVDRINERNEKNVQAELVKVDKVMQGSAPDYAVIIDRISHHVPFYKAYLKTAALNGTAVANNPFATSADDNFFVTSLAKRLGIPVPKSVLLPSNQRPNNTNAESFSNLVYPMDWEGIFNYVGFPAAMKPLTGSNERNFSRFENQDDFFRAHNETGQEVMMIVEDIMPQEFYRCYCIGGKETRIMQYDPSNPYQQTDAQEGLSKKLMNTMKDCAIQLCTTLGYDINTVHFAVKDGKVYALDICNPVPKADPETIGQEAFEWMLDATATFAIKKAKAHKDSADNLTWGTFMKNSTQGQAIAEQSPKEETGTAKATKTSTKSRGAATKDTTEGPTDKRKAQKEPVKKGTADVNNR